MINTDRNLFLQCGHNIVAVTSGIGSTGKTWLALSLAQAVNFLKTPVLLFDADNGLLNSGFQSGAELQGEISMVMEGKKTLNQIITPLGRKKFDIITGSAGSNALGNAPAGRLQILSEELSVISRNYAYTFVDLPQNEHLFGNLLPEMSDLLLVCTNGPSNLVSAYNFLQTIPGIVRYERLYVVVNCANSYEEGLQTYNILRHACERYIKIVPPLLGVIRRDTRVRDAVNNRVLFLSRYPSSEAAEDVMSIAHRLVGERSKI